MADKFADLVITLSKLGIDSYWVELRFSRLDELTEKSPERAPAHLNFLELRQTSLDPRAYGNLLKQAVFSEPRLSGYFHEALAVSQQKGINLRVRLLVDRSAPELHSLRWEMLLHPQTGSFLARDQNLLFSRHLYSPDWSQVELRSKGALRALVFVSSPSALDRPGGFRLRLAEAGERLLAPIDIPGEVSRAQAALQGALEVKVVASDASHPGHASLESLLASLRHGWDIVYLVCHGALLPDEPGAPGSPRRPYLLLEKAEGGPDMVDGERLVDLVQNLPLAQRPRLVVLASCQSAAIGRAAAPIPDSQPESVDQGDLAALGPRLVEAGVPAVLAMQANVTMETVARFMPVFFDELLDHGQVDRASAAARSAVESRPDWWVPVLFLRLRGGQLWYQAGFTGRDAEFDLWPGIINSIRHRRCVPVLGFGLLEFLAGSQREIARRWAETDGFPLHPHLRDDLAQVTQFLSQQGVQYPKDRLLDHIRNRVEQEYRSILPADISQRTSEELLGAIGRWRREHIPGEAYTLLASLPFEIYITANPDNLLEEALKAQNRQPQSMYSHWNPRLVSPDAIRAHKKLLPPSQQAPLVYHLFGILGDRRSLVLTEDDFFEYMMWVNNPKAQVPIPDVILGAWREAALLFLGFQMSDWDFRLLFRSILNEDRRQEKRDYRSVAVQLQPGDGYLRPERARRYLEKFFTENQLAIYWGSPDEFLASLWDAWCQEDPG